MLCLATSNELYNFINTSNENEAKHEIVEELIGNDQDLIYLESLRYLIKEREDYLPYTSNQISQLLKKS